MRALVRVVSQRGEREDRINLAACGLVPCSAETVRDADTTALANDRISVTPLDGDWTADERVLGQIHGRLRNLTRP